MARVKTNTMSDLIAVAEIKEMLTRVETKLDLLLSTRITQAVAPTSTIPADEGPKGWTKDELKAWVNGLDGLTRANIACGAVDPQEVWESMKEEKGW